MNNFWLSTLGIRVIKVWFIGEGKVPAFSQENWSHHDPPWARIVGKTAKAYHQGLPLLNEPLA